jgi:hypothetical protein
VRFHFSLKKGGRAGVVGVRVRYATVVPFPFEKWMNHVTPLVDTTLFMALRPFSKKAMEKSQGGPPGILQRAGTRPHIHYF